MMVGVRTFVVRIVEPGPADEPLRGVVQVVGGDEEITFHDDTQLIALLRRNARVVAGGGEP